ncbi:TonB-dependent receptor [Neolewinella antarctica]|uniref:Iron complex outermembrane receptor protein n=1 Tax=Neolewinella antarctica TaxID=442734 RepID=A0ABX0XAH0_9BACT|nr:TonB-dependent receptor [Neolewinella antarctica]NJC25934.1 iron complex outermembrane receptor protein [Neolewinella antarctica]
MKRFLLSAGLALATICTLTAQFDQSTVVDNAGFPIEGVAITSPTSTQTTYTDGRGKFQLPPPDKEATYNSSDNQARLSANGSPMDDRIFSFQSIGYAQRSFQILDVMTFKPQRIVMQPTGYELNQIIVSATAATSKTPVTYTNLEKAEIQERNLGQDAPYLLKWTPSVVVNSDAGTGIGYTGIWIRGSDPSRTNVTINGIPYNDSESQGVFWVNLPDFSSSADQIQIQRGVGTSTNGAGAFGASINFNTNQLAEARKLSVDGSLGSFGTRRGAVQYTSGLLDNGLKVDARYSKIHSDGYIDRASADLDGYYAGVTYNKPGTNAVLRFNAFGGHEVTYQSWNGVTQGEIDAAGRRSYQTVLGGILQPLADEITQRDIDEAGRTYNSVGTEKDGEPYDNEVDNYRQNHYQLHYNNEFGGKWNFGVSGHYTRGLGYFEQYKADEDPADYLITNAGVEETDVIRRRWLDNHFYGTVYSLRYRATRNLDFTFGGSANEYLGDHYGQVIWARDAGDSEIRDRYYENDASKRDFSNYLRANYGFADGFNAYVDLQVRTVNYDFEGIDNTGEFINQDEQLTFFNPKFGLLYDFGDGQAYASFGIAQREPNRSDFVDNPVDSRPVPEKLFNTEIGIRKQAGSFNYGVNAYFMDYQNQLVLTGAINDVGENVRTNVADSYRLGVELQGGYQLGDFVLGGNVTLSRNRVASFTERLDLFDEGGLAGNYIGEEERLQEDKPLSFSPSVTGALGLEYLAITTKNHRLSAALQGKYVGERFVDNSGFEQSALDAYYYADLRVSYRFAPTESPLGALRLTFLVRNVTDRLYVSNGWSYRYGTAGAETTLKGMYPQAGRNYMVGLGFDF